MSNFVNFIFAAVFLTILIISSVYAIKAERRVYSHRNKDKHLNAAFRELIASAIMTWAVIGIALILIVLSAMGVIAIFGSGEGEAAEGVEALVDGAPKKHGTWETSLFLGGSVILTGVVGGLSAAAAVQIHKSPLSKIGEDPKNDTERDLQKAYTDSVISAVLALVSVGVLVIGFIVYTVILHKRKKHQQEVAAQLNQLHVNAAINSLKAPPLPARVTIQPQPIRAPSVQTPVRYVQPKVPIQPVSVPIQPAKPTAVPVLPAQSVRSVAQPNRVQTKIVRRVQPPIRPAQPPVKQSGSKLPQVTRARQLPQPPKPLSPTKSLPPLPPSRPPSGNLSTTTYSPRT